MKSFSLEKSHYVKLALFNQSSNFIDMVRYKLVYSIVTDSAGADEQSIAEAQHDQNTSFAKINAFITNIVDHSLVVKDGEELDNVLAGLGNYENNIIVLPDVHESLIVSALHSKFNVIAGPNTFVELVELVNLDEELSYKLFCDEDEMEYFNLPQQSEWQGELTYWKEPWWTRYDTGTMDRTANNPEEYAGWLKASEEENLEVQQVALFNEIDRQIELMYNAGESPKSGEVVHVDFAEKPWKPQIV